jgi:hypothetical protein
MKSKTNPKRTQSKQISEKLKMNITSFLTRNYEQRIMNNELIKTNPTSKRRKTTCFGSNYPYNCWFGINIGDFLCVNNAAVVLTQKPPSKTR